MDREQDQEHQYYYNYMSELWEKKLTEERRQKSCTDKKEPEQCHI